MPGSLTEHYSRLPPTTLRFADDYCSRFPDGHGHDSYVEFGFHDQLRTCRGRSPGMDHDIGQRDGWYHGVEPCVHG